MSSARKQTNPDDWEVVHVEQGHSVDAVIQSRYKHEEFILLAQYCKKHELSLAKGIHDIVMQHLLSEHA
jgi:hypothetical protein